MAKKKSTTKKAGERGSHLPPEVAAIRNQLKVRLDEIYPYDSLKRKVGNATFGVYAFLDYDGEPIYVGQTYEGLRDRIGRHLTNQRTDAVAMHVLDPFEVLSVRLWPLFDLQDAVHSHPANSAERKQELDEAKEHLEKAEYTVYQDLLAASHFEAVLNEKDIAGRPDDRVTLPSPVEFQIVPPEVFVARKHPDLRIARRAATIAKLAQVISERDVSKGLRRTLVTQARRLLDLAEKRFHAIGGTIPVEEEGP
jgi:hypothetical protein